MNNLSRRDMLAGMALQGICASFGSACDYADDNARLAVKNADALIAELDKTSTTSA